MIAFHTMRRVVAAILVVVVALVSSLQLASGHTPAEVAKQISGNELQLTVELYSEVFNERKAAGAERLIADDAVIHTPRGDFTGPDGLLEYLDSIYTTYPDASFEVTSIDSDADTIVVRWTMTATQMDLMYGPTDALVSSPGETTITIANGQVVAINQAERGTAVQPAEDIAAQSPTEEYADEVGISRGADPVQ